MTEIIQKAKFLGKHGQIFNIGAKSFASNIWRPITQDEIAKLREAGVISQFEFQPPIDLPYTSDVVEIEEVVRKPRKKKKKKEGDK